MDANPSSASGRCPSKPSGPRRRYRIILRGECGQLLAGALDEVAIESGQGWTCVMASVRDESELYGLLDRFEDFALHIVSLNELGADVTGPLPPAGGYQ